VQPVFFITMAALSFSRLVAVFYALHVDPIEDRNVKGESRCMQPDKAGALTLLPNLPVALNPKKKKKNGARGTSSLTDLAQSMSGGGQRASLTPRQVTQCSYLISWK
jgi:hypothetical protein